MNIGNLLLLNRKRITTVFDKWWTWALNDSICEKFGLNLWNETDGGKLVGLDAEVQLLFHVENLKHVTDVKGEKGDGMITW